MRLQRAGVPDYPAFDRAIKIRTILNCVAFSNVGDMSPQPLDTIETLAQPFYSNNDPLPRHSQLLMSSTTSERFVIPVIECLESLLQPDAKQMSMRGLL